jgi:hypothetical protein
MRNVDEPATPAHQTVDDSVIPTIVTVVAAARSVWSTQARPR